MDNAEAQEAFRFLSDSCGYRRESQSGVISYQSSALVVSPSYSERDGFDTHLVFPLYSASSISVGTILSAIDCERAHDIPAQVTFIRSNLKKLEQIQPSIHDDLDSLRFWHGPKWRKEWGRTIRMPPDALEPEMARLSRLREYFNHDS